MAMMKEELHRMIDELSDKARESAYDYLRFLTTKHSRPDWDEIIQMEAEDIALSQEEERQMKCTEFVSWEDAMRELDLPTDTKP